MLTNIATRQFAEALDATLLDASGWRRVCDELGSVFGAIGSCIIPTDAEQRGPWMVHSESLADGVNSYLRDGWHKRDYRQACISIARARGYATDIDIATPEIMERHPYYVDLIRRNGLGMFVGIHLRIGSHEWIASIHRALDAEPLDQSLLSKIPPVRNELLRVAQASYAIGTSRLDTWVANFDNSEHGVAFLDRRGRVVRSNGVAEQLLITVGLRSDGTIVFADSAVDRRYEMLVASLSDGVSGHPLPPPIVIETAPGHAAVLELLKFPAALRHFGLDHCGLLLVRRATMPVADLAGMLFQKFGLSPAETRIAMAIGEGRSPRDVASQLRLAESTVRQQLKATFRKIGIHSQSQLATLIAKLKIR